MGSLSYRQAVIQAPDRGGRIMRYQLTEKEMDCQQSGDELAFELRLSALDGDMMLRCK
jgi:hypothetical protein